ncbi:hypothetical protein [Anaerostipes faecalis]|uniref:hypothetical protein n=2 Tax=Lachnospiraceae TaxID=186803 RepID=UPI0009532AE8
MSKNDTDCRFMAMPAYIGGKFDMAGMKWYGGKQESKVLIWKADLQFINYFFDFNVTKTINLIMTML